MPTHDPVAAHVPDLGIEEGHRAALPLRAAGGLAEKLCHRHPRVHPKRQTGAMAAVAVDEIVLPLRKRGGDPDRDRFLTAVHVTDPADLLARLLVLLDSL